MFILYFHLKSPKFSFSFYFLNCWWMSTEEQAKLKGLMIIKYFPGLLTEQYQNVKTCENNHKDSHIKSIAVVRDQTTAVSN